MPLNNEICKIMSLDLSKEILFSSSDTAISRQISSAEKKGLIKKIVPRLFTTNLLDSLENIVKRNLFDILSWRYPGAVISHRSAHEVHLTRDGVFFMTFNYDKKVTDLPGMTIHIMKGPQAIESDIPFDALYISSESRWMLENMQDSRKQGEQSKTFPSSFIEERLERMILMGGEAQLNAFRDKTREASVALNMSKEFERINILISALLATHSADALSTKSAKSRAAGTPYDKDRGELFEILFKALKDRFFMERRNKNNEESSFRLFSFFESYFSNYIEGTKFKVEEAKQIIDSGKAFPKRIKDSHDIIGTFAILSNRAEMNKTPQTVEELYKLLRDRHRTLMGKREECTPGLFKTMNNQAGNTVFVNHQLVEGTLRYGFKFYSALTDPLAKAIFMMFMISEVHPFVDGNGRISRIMMNAELVKGDQSRIIVPTVFRDDYILTLRKLSRQKDPEPFIRVIEKLHRFSDNLYGNDYNELNNYLQDCNAFEEPTDAKLTYVERTFESLHKDDFDKALEEEKRKFLENKKN